MQTVGRTMSLLETKKRTINQKILYIKENIAAETERFMIIPHSPIVSRSVVASSQANEHRKMVVQTKECQNMTSHLT